MIRISSRLALILLLVVGASQLGACGQKGPLYMPKQNTAQSH